MFRLAENLENVAKVAASFPPPIYMSLPCAPLFSSSSNLSAGYVMQSSSRLTVTAGNLLRTEAETLPKLMLPSIYCEAILLTVFVSSGVDRSISRAMMETIQNAAIPIATLPIHLPEPFLVLFVSFSKICRLFVEVLTYKLNENSPISSN